MPLNIISNFASHIAQRNLAISDSAATTSLAKLSSGSRVVSAKDDAASMAVGSRLAAEVVGLKQASVNAGQAISMLQIADGAMSKINDIMIRLKSLSVQAGSGQLSGTERAMLDTEYQALVSEVDRISNDTDFAGTQLVDGAISVDRSSATAFETADGVQDIIFRGDTSTAGDATIASSAAGTFSVTLGTDVFTGSIPSDTNDGSSMSTGTVVTLTNTSSSNKVDLVLNTAYDVDLTKADGTLDLSGSSTTSFSFKVGTGTSSTADEILVTISSVSSSALSIGTTSITSKADADIASVAISNAIDDIQTARADVGANQNRLEFAAANIATATENTEAARSQLLDLDVASEMSNFTSKQILMQAGVSMLAQANQLPQNLMQLFQ
ncbi:MAG: flagellin [Alphaproteobacteria bacterium]|nr:flagellin [Alphaproteobacteria bacterium]